MGRYMHEDMVEKIKELRERIETGYPLPGGNKMVDQEAERELERIARMYQKELGYLPKDVFERLIEAFQKCLDLNFFWWEIKEEIKKAIKNLKDLEKRKALENFKMSFAR